MDHQINKDNLSSRPHHLVQILARNPMAANQLNHHQFETQANDETNNKNTSTHGAMKPPLVTDKVESGNKKRPVAASASNQFDDADEPGLQKGEQQQQRASEDQHQGDTNKRAKYENSSATNGGGAAPPPPLNQPQQQQPPVVVPAGDSSDEDQPPTTVTPEPSLADINAIANGKAPPNNTNAKNMNQQPVLPHQLAAFMAANPAIAANPAMFAQHHSTFMQGYLNSYYRAAAMQPYQQAQSANQNPNLQQILPNGMPNPPFYGTPHPMLFNPYAAAQHGHPQQQPNTTAKNAKDIRPTMHPNQQQPSGSQTQASPKAVPQHIMTRPPTNQPQKEPPSLPIAKGDEKPKAAIAPKKPPKEAPKNKDTKHGGKWQRQYENAKLFEQKYGHCIIPNDYDEIPGLGSWAKRQRYQYQLFRQNLKVKERSSSLNVERIKMLEKIGFCWNPKDRKWFTRYGELLQFIRKHGHATVPTVYPPNQELAGWTKVQRRQHRLFLMKKPTSLTLERIRLLNKVGFVWSMQCEKEKDNEEYNKYFENPDNPVKFQRKNLDDAKGYILVKDKSIVLPSIDSNEKTNISVPAHCRKSLYKKNKAGVKEEKAEGPAIPITTAPKSDSTSKTKKAKGPSIPIATASNVPIATAPYMPMTTAPYFPIVTAPYFPFTTAPYAPNPAAPMGPRADSKTPDMSSKVASTEATEGVKGATTITSKPVAATAPYFPFTTAPYAPNPGAPAPYYAATATASFFPFTTVPYAPNTADSKTISQAMGMSSKIASTKANEELKGTTPKPVAPTTPWIPFTTTPYAPKQAAPMETLVDSKTTSETKDTSSKIAPSKEEPKPVAPIETPVDSKTTVETTVAGSPKNDATETKAVDDNTTVSSEPFVEKIKAEADAVQALLSFIG